MNRGERVRRFACWLSKVTASAAACGMLCVALPTAAQEKPESAGGNSSQGAGMYFNAEATAKDVGLPVYPRARPHKKKADDSTSAKFGLWVSTFAFKLAVVKLESNDPPEKIAAFYKRALAKYGTVLDCGAASAQVTERDKDESSKNLACEAISAK